MSLRRMCLFAVLSMLVAFAVVGGLNRRTKVPEVPKPNMLPPTHTLLRYSGPPMQRLGKSHSFSSVQSKNAKDLAAGRLLVASRNLADPNFAETVILLVHYDVQGVLGLILNRRTNVPLSRVLEDLTAAKDRSDPVYLGGPVETPAVLGLFRSAAKIEGAEHIFDGVYLISTRALFEQTIAVQPDPGVFRVYLGYAGWTNEQLQEEVALGSWFIFPADVSTVFDSDPDSLWSQMIRKTELRLAESGTLDKHTWTSAGQLGPVNYER